MKQPQSTGFALISTLAVLVVVSILVVAYTTTIRTERGASVNFSERERADAIGQAMVSRLMSDHAAPKIGTAGKRLKPFTLKKKPDGTDDESKVPDADTESTYFAQVPIPEIYSMKAQANLSSKNTLVRISQPDSGDSENSPAAYTPYDWAYSRVPVTANSDVETQKAFLPYDSTDQLITPKWVDYFGPVDPNDPAAAGDPVPVGEVAFAIWDESGKVDINVAGKDDSLNGMAPHNLGWENLASAGKSAELLAHLNGTNNLRDRNNFSLRKINSVAPALNRLGDDRWIFSVDELFTRNLFPPDTYKQLTTYSRDFDVRPEWDGNRAPANASTFLRSYINNPNLFVLFANEPKASSKMVAATFDEKALKQKLSDATQGTIQPTDDAMQIMRLLAALRLSLPPFRNLASPTWDQPLGLKVAPAASAGGGSPPAPISAGMEYREWTDDDVYGIALNIMQGSAPVGDQNLFAFDRNVFTVQPFNDPNVRVGVRAGPYITEAAIKVKRTEAGKVEVYEYFEVWNPYPVDLRTEKYVYGSWTGSTGNGNETKGGFYGYTGKWEFGNGTTVSGPAPGGFILVQMGPKSYDVPTDRRFLLRTRPYLYNYNYWTGHRTGSGGGLEESSSWVVSIAPFYTVGGDTAQANLHYHIPAARLAAVGDVAWASYQIDDPRMGPFTRQALYTGLPDDKNLTNMRYSWKYFPDQHSLPTTGSINLGANNVDGSKTAKHVVSPTYGPPFGPNFGENAPPGFTLKNMMATFALPRRPYMNVGELGGVFANRPWRTLSFAASTVPTDPAVARNSNERYMPTTLLDYLTTIGTTTDRVNLPYKSPAVAPEGTTPIAANVKLRQQEKLWLFESVGANGVATGNLRPIRGRINLNSASYETLMTLLKAPYRVARWTGPGVRTGYSPEGSYGILKGSSTDWPDLRPVGVTSAADSDVFVTISDSVAKEIAVAIAGDPGATPPKLSIIRPLRSMADLAKLDTWPTASPSNLIRKLHGTLPDPVVDAIIGRLAQFGTVRQQIFRVDMAARSLNRNIEKQRLKNPSIKRVVTAEVRFQTRLYFDTFSRKAFVESIEYR